MRIAKFQGLFEQNVQIDDFLDICNTFQVFHCEVLKNIPATIVQTNVFGGYQDSEMCSSPYDYHPQRYLLLKRTERRTQSYKNTNTTAVQFA